MGRLLPPSALLAPVARLLVRPGEDGAHMGGCFCIPGEPSLSWDPGEFPGGTLACVLAEVARPVKAQGFAGLGELLFQRWGDGGAFWLPPLLVSICHSAFVRKE